MKSNLRNTLLGASAAALLVGVAASPAQAGATDFYARLDSGYSMGSITSHENQTEKVGNSIIFGATAGYQLGYGLSVELGLSYRGGYKYEASVDKTTSKLSVQGMAVKADTSALTILPQVVYRLDMVPVVVPYAALGVGYSRNTTGDGTVTVPASVTSATGVTGGTVKGATANNLAFSIGAGIEYSVLPFLDIQVGYRYLNLGAFKTASSSPFTPTFAAGTPDVAKAGVNALASKVTYDDRKPVANEIVVGVGYRF